MTTAPFTTELIEGFRAITTPSIADALQKNGMHGYVHSRIQRHTGAKLVGPAVTVKEEPWDGEPEPPVHALALIDEAEAGSVVVIDNGADETVACWGGLMTAGAVANKLAGTVIDGCFRDAEEIQRDFGYTVYAVGRSAATTVGRFRTVASNVPVELGGVTVHPGDLIVGDGDGLVVVPAAHVEAILAEASLIESREKEQTRLILESGSLATGLAKYNLV